MSENLRYQPCHGCGSGSYILGSRAFACHFERCTKVLLKPSTNHTKSKRGNDGITKGGFDDKNTGVTQTKQTAKPTIYNFEIDSIGNPIIRRNVLQAHHGLLHPKDGNDLEPFQFENCDNNRWELNNDLVPDEVNPLVLDSNDKTPIKIPFAKEVPISNKAFSFQIDLMDLLQRHKTDLNNFTMKSSAS